jgi:hypothetical protein
LCERIWEHAHEYDTKLVEVFIGRLRKRVGDPPLIHRQGTIAVSNDPMNGITGFYIDGNGVFHGFLRTK